MTPGPTNQPFAPTRLVRVLVGALCLAAAGSVIALVVAIVDVRSPGDVAAPVGAAAEVSDSHRRGAVRVLRRWDDARARAWERADLRALRRLYTPRSAAGRRDVAMLRRWRERGLRVVEMRTQVTSVRVVRHGRRRLVLVVTDRLARAVAAGRGQRRALPVDGPTTRRLTLHRAPGVWKVASVVPVG